MSSDTPIKIGVVGSRDYASYDEVKGLINRIAAKYPNATIYSGGCRGVDTWAKLSCHRRLKTVEYVVVQSKHDHDEDAPYFISNRIEFRDGGMVTNPLVNNITGDGFYRSFGQAAHRRNQRIASAVDVLVALWDGKSTGTKSTIHYAKAADTLVVLYQQGKWVVPGV